MISILVCSWLPLPSFVSLHLSPCVIFILVCFWLLLHLSCFVTSILACSWLLLPSFVSLHSPDSWKLSGFLFLNDWVADHRNRLNGRDAAAALSLHDLILAALGCPCRLLFQACLPS